MKLSTRSLPTKQCRHIQILDLYVITIKLKIPIYRSLDLTIGFLLQRGTFILLYLRVLVCFYAFIVLKHLTGDICS